MIRLKNKVSASQFRYEITGGKLTVTMDGLDAKVVARLQGKEKAVFHMQAADLKNPLWYCFHCMNITAEDASFADCNELMKRWTQLLLLLQTIEALDEQVPDSYLKPLCENLHITFDAHAIENCLCFLFREIGKYEEFEEYKDEAFK